MFTQLDCYFQFRGIGESERYETLRRSSRAWKKKRKLVIRDVWIQKQNKIVFGAWNFRPYFPPSLMRRSAPCILSLLFPRVFKICKSVDVKSIKNSFGLLFTFAVRIISGHQKRFKLHSPEKWGPNLTVNNGGGGWRHYFCYVFSLVYGPTISLRRRCELGITKTKCKATSEQHQGNLQQIFDCPPHTAPVIESGWVEEKIDRALLLE